MRRVLVWMVVGRRSRIPEALLLLVLAAPAGCGGSKSGAPGPPGPDLCAGVVCRALDQCHAVGACNPATGTCSTPAKADGATCDDANACTQTDACQAGVCVGVNPVVCTALDACHDTGVCNPVTGVCSSPARPDGATCSDGNGCTLADTCQGGSCLPGPPVTCVALDVCHDVGVCVPQTGQCTNPPKPGGCPGLPPDPADVAPPLSPTGATSLADATAFLYTGASPIQTGVAAGTIDPLRVAVLRGRVLARDGNPVAGVQVSIRAHPELGQTLTRVDGRFDLAVNGGGLLVIRYQLAGHLPVERQIQVPWRDYAFAPEVVLTPADAQVTSIDLTASVAMQVARGSPSGDADGARRATVMIPQGTQAQVLLPDGSTQPVSTLHVRLTEYTVGASGPAAMPAQLPAASGYTYAFELRADESVAKIGGKDLLLDRPVPFYVENFLQFPVGMAVPTGYYDADRAAWVPIDNGRVIQVLDVSGGLATLDTTGTGSADNGVALGVSDAERHELAGLYPPGQTLWRVALPHFSTWDSNWGVGPGCTGVCKAPDPPDPPGPPPPDPDSCNEDNASTITCDAQVLGETVKVAGTPHALHYGSDRVPGSRSLTTREIPLTGATVDPALARIDLEIVVQGRLLTRSFPPAPSQTFTFTWDGKDAYGRAAQGPQPISIRVGHVYPGVYRSPAELKASFGYAGNGLITGRQSRKEITLWRETQGMVGQGNVPSAGLGGWTLTPHHAYYSVSQILHQGDGRQRSARALVSVIERVIKASSIDGLRPFANDVAVAPDGAIYFSFQDSIYRLAPDGTLVRLAGTPGTSCDMIHSTCGDGGLATQALFLGQNGLSLGADGSVYVADTGNNRIRRIDPGGVISTVAGGGATAPSPGAALPATQAALGMPWAVAVGPDGSLFIAGLAGSLVYRVDPAGVLTVVAGGGSTQVNVGDRVPATQALVFAEWVATGPDGSLYLSGTEWAVYRVDPAGTISIVAGSRAPCAAPTDPCGDGGAATQAQLSGPAGLAVGPDGSLYLRDGNRVRRVAPDGKISTVAGTGDGTPCQSAGGCGIPGPAPRALLSSSNGGVALAPDGNLYLGGYIGQGVLRVAPVLPGFALGEQLVAAEDGREAYVFESTGRHLRTLDTLTGAALLRFAYDAAGRLQTLTDVAGNVTTVERTAAGDPVALVAPFGQRTTFGLDAGGYLAAITSPAGETHRMSYSADGLLATFTDPRNETSTMTYDAVGRLVRDADAAGGAQTLTRAPGEDVTRATALGRATRYRHEVLATGDRVRTNTFPDGTQAVLRKNADGSVVTNLPDGTTATVQQGADPRFGLLAPLPLSWKTTTPGGLTRTATLTRASTLATPGDPFSLVTETDTVGINGRNYTLSYSAATRTLTGTSPAGRQASTTYDASGRRIQAAAGGLTPLQLAYDARGRLASATRGARSHALAYDVQGYLSAVTDPLGQTASATLDPVGRPTLQTRSGGAQVGLAYDAAGNLATLVTPGGSVHGFDYTPVNLLQAYTPPSVGVATAAQYAWDLDRQPVQQTQPGAAASLAYDAAGRLQTVTHALDTVTRAYDAAGHLQSLTTASGMSVSLGYDGSLPTSSTWSGPVAGSVGHAYDNDFRVVRQTVNAGSAATFAYDADGLLTGAGALTLQRSAQSGLLTGTALGTLSDATTYSSFGEPASYAASFGASPLYAAEYTRDALGRITQIIETVAGSSTTTGYVYDAANRLSQVLVGGAVSATYTYDASGNRLTGPGVATPASYDAQDRLLQYGAATYGWAASGALQSRAGAQTSTYVYDALGNLRGVVLPGGATVDYLVDGLNRRVGKKVNGTLVQGFLYKDQLNPVAELDGGGAVVSRFVYGSRDNVPDYLVRGGVTYRIIADHLGSPRLVVDAGTGAVAQRMDYDAFGNVLADTNPGFQPFGFAGGLYDRDTGLVRFGARDYDPETGRWTAKDPLGFAAGDPDLYAYVSNDPVNGRDPTGLVPRCKAALLCQFGGLMLIGGGIGLLGVGVYTGNILIGGLGLVAAGGGSAAITYCGLEILDGCAPDPPPPPCKGAGR